jgi:hypothetical protein
MRLLLAFGEILAPAGDRANAQLSEFLDTTIAPLRSLSVLPVRFSRRVAAGRRDLERKWRERQAEA